MQKKNTKKMLLIILEWPETVREHHMGVLISWSTFHASQS